MQLCMFGAYSEKDLLSPFAMTVIDAKLQKVMRSCNRPRLLEASYFLRCRCGVTDSNLLWFHSGEDHKPTMI